MSDKRTAGYRILCLAAFIVTTLLTCAAQGQTYKTLYSFSGGSDGIRAHGQLDPGHRWQFVRDNQKWRHAGFGRCVPTNRVREGKRSPQLCGRHRRAQLLNRG